MNAIPLLLVFLVVAYFLLIRPQKQRVRYQRDMLSSIAVGDHVVTTGGIVGDVVGANDERMQLEIADGVVIEVLRMSINRRIEESVPFWGAASDDDDEEAEEIEDDEGGEGEYHDDEESTGDDTEEAAEGDPGEAAEGDPGEAAEGGPESDEGGAVADEAAGGDGPGAAGSNGSIEEGAVPAPGQDPH